MDTLDARVAGLTGREVARVVSLGGSHAWKQYRAELADGVPLFVKALPETAAGDEFTGMFQQEALGLDWLGRSLGALVPDVIAWDSHTLVLSWVEERPPTPQAAESFGHRLAAMHLAGADFFGAERDGFIGPLPLDNTPATDWSRFYAEQRLAPYLRRAVDRGALTPVDARTVEKVIDAVEDLAGAPEPPARIHGDLWSGNVLWQADGAVLVDPAAHGGHRETDLAMLALFGSRTWTGPATPTTRRPRSPRGGASGSPCTSSTRCSCTCACSAPPTAPRRWRRPGPRCGFSAPVRNRPTPDGSPWCGFVADPLESGP